MTISTAPYHSEEEEEDDNDEDDNLSVIDSSTSSVVDSDALGEDLSDHDLKKKRLHDANDDDAYQNAIAKAETQAVKRLKLVVLGVLTLLAVGVALAVYYYTSGAEQVQFEDAFQGDASKVLEGLGSSLERTIGGLDLFAAMIVSVARATNQTWPFVTIPNFPLIASKIRLLSQTVLLTLYPIVTQEERSEWEAYSTQNDAWVNESMNVQETDEFYYGPIMYNFTLHGIIHGDLADVPPNVSLMMPTWQNSPVVGRQTAYNWDYLSTGIEGLYLFLDSHRAMMAPPTVGPWDNSTEGLAEYEVIMDYFKDFVAEGENPKEPNSDLYYPVIDSDLKSLRIVDNATDPNRPPLVALLAASMFWKDLIKDILPQGTDGIVVVFASECTEPFTYQLNGPQTVYLGAGDHHETQFDNMVVESQLQDLGSYFIRKSQYTGIPLDETFCPLTVKVYPSTTMQVQYLTSNPIYITVGAVMIFVFTSAVFLLYDFYVERRQKKVMTTAVRTNAIVSSLFPSVVRDRLYQTEDSHNENTDKKTMFKLANSKARLKTFLSDGSSSGIGDMDETEAGGVMQLKSAPIAELFPETTVMFADIAGFTAWSSVRDPTQVFTLLETLYGAFDTIARRRGVFKVETIGDSYVAVCGLPEPRADHAVVMARFARDCREKMIELTRKLEKSLGPDTGDLKLRFGLNSGPVTAGVLRGERARFQLFGDTVNCAARMESNGSPNLIQASQKTADLLTEAGKHHWLKRRDEFIEVKGKGTMQTYWVEPPQSRSSASSGDQTASDTGHSDADTLHVMGVSRAFDEAMAAKLERLIDWNMDTFASLVKNIVARRVAMGGDAEPREALDHALLKENLGPIAPRGEVSEVIVLPDFAFNLKAGKKEGAALDNVELSGAVLWQLRDYITAIAYMYRNNAFHNFEHASHVAFSTRKMLQRVVSPDVSVAVSSESRESKVVAEELASRLHFSTFGITSDPLTQFAIVFAALIHDVDHPGVSNGQLVAERDPLALAYDNLSVAEQNSVAIAWELLLRPTYAELRSCLFGNVQDLHRFRQLVVNSVMATDIFDKDLKAMRESRWEKAFHGPSSVEGPAAPGSESSLDFHRKATIVIEHLIQSSDVAHTMQHWTVYQKWNKRLFQEMYSAFRNGRSSVNPADGWYKGELWFFDNYIIPLAKKLKECRVFGVSCDEFLDYALDNRTEWEAKGESIVHELVEAAHAAWERRHPPSRSASVKHLMSHHHHRPLRSTSATSTSSCTAASSAAAVAAEAEAAAPLLHTPGKAPTNHGPGGNTAKLRVEI